jgi:hypothetical protein
MTLAATMHRVATGEKRELAANPVPWRVEDGERFLVEVPNDHCVGLDGRSCTIVKAGSAKTYLVELGVHTFLGARRIEVRRRGEVAYIDIMTTGGLRAVERLLPDKAVWGSTRCDGHREATNGTAGTLGVGG